MDDPLPVGIVERGADLAYDAGHLRHRHPAVLTEPVAQRAARHVRGYVIEQATGLAGVDQRENVGMGQPCRNPDLAKEAVGAEEPGQVGMQHLDRHAAVVFAVFREVDGCHAAAAELMLEQVAVGECFGQGTRWGGHRT